MKGTWKFDYIRAIWGYTNEYTFLLDIADRNYFIVRLQSDWNNSSARKERVMHWELL